VRLYVDTSALIKTIKTELESSALLEVLSLQVSVLSSRLVETELLRAVQAYGLDVGTAFDRLNEIDMVELTPAQIRQAGLLPHPAGGKIPRALDALHVVAALEGEVDAFVTYDANQADAAHEAGIEVLEPTPELVALLREGGPQPPGLRVLAELSRLMRGSG